ncbi:GIN domain-containing protein [Tamlana crocina]|uniref:DUF2807 domain-containing protein n=1 Tax=Tamlana crocina TaxID=393006 RepID=A0ABX1D6P3_9FLAO|nr:DUF2807 domain-containing protein [Tamlana crocina]NJX14020.1 DUF2807 domain-containing protein [Tamlana crocina]
MKTVHFVYMVFAFTIFLSSCSVEGIKASNTIITEERTLTNFSEVQISNDIEVVIKKGTEHSVKITTSDNIIDHVRTRVKNGKLIASLSGNIRRLNELKLEIVMPNLSSLELSADSYGVCSGFENLETLHVKVSSDAFIRLNGSAKNLTINASSDAKIEGFNFVANTCNVNCSSDASVAIHCVEQLQGKVSSDAVVFYKGSPIVNVSTSSDGAVINTN